MDQTMLTKIHNTMTEILDKFVCICSDNNLTYFLVYGTLLGAVRHKGFIPWDDDIDVAMPRADYNKLIEIYKSKNDPDYYLITNENSPINTHYHYNTFIKLCKKRTIIAEESRDEKDYCGIYIDIWPYDNCLLPLLPLQTFLIKLGIRIYKLKTYDNIVIKNALFIKKIIKKIMPLPIVKLYYSFSLKLYYLFNNKKTKYFSFLCGLEHYRFNTHKYENVFPLTKVLFCGKYYNAPHNYNLFLKITYDDNFMTQPPIEERKIHSKYAIFDTENKNFD